MPQSLSKAFWKTTFPWGVAPGLNEPAPLALNTYRSATPLGAQTESLRSESCLQPQPLWDKNAIEQIEEPLDD